MNIQKHVEQFPAGGAILTTGAITTHVNGRAIILGPHDITKGVLAHEFGHILGFRDAYFRGYKDLAEDGFQVLEIVADSNDIMGAPATGAVLRRHYEKLISVDTARNRPGNPNCF
jgi:bacillopeptidase F (M6 metalloprotease family)